jgi:peptide-methionine (S)-S-oxide reductase
MEKPFEHLEGVISAISGYTGGHIESPSYKDVSRGITGHIESVQVTYDPTKLGYKTLLDTFWINIDPLDGQGQFCDKGEQYRSAVFYQNNEQKILAEKSLENIASKLDKNIETTLIKATTFYPAEEYHQDYYLKNPLRYAFYRSRCGRDKRLKELWGS